MSIEIFKLFVVILYIFSILYLVKVMINSMKTRNAGIFRKIPLDNGVGIV